jgi:DNA modification methylase
LTELLIESWPIDRPKPYPGNARKLSKRAISTLATSLREYGWRQPIVVDDADVIIAGHTRLKAAQSLGLSHVPVHVARDLTPEQVAGYRLMDNRSADETEWDVELLSAEMAKLNLAEFDLSLTGFDSAEIRDILFANHGGLTDPDEAPEPPADPVAQTGDVWLLGTHRVLCGDSTVLSDVQRLMAADVADLVVTDPPYNVAYEGKTKDALTIENDSMSAESFYQFLLSTYSNMLMVAGDGAGIYVFHPDVEIVNFTKAFIDAGFKHSQHCVWVKQQFVMGRKDYHCQHELVLYGWKPTGAHRWHSDRKQTTVWNFDRPTRSTEHPTMKPVALIEYPISNSSRTGEIVLDLFGGSGSTLIACEKTGRAARLMEIDRKFVDVIIARWEAFSGAKATLEGDGRTFEEIKAERIRQ